MFCPSLQYWHEQRGTVSFQVLILLDWKLKLLRDGQTLEIVYGYTYTHTYIYTNYDFLMCFLLLFSSSNPSERQAARPQVRVDSKRRCYPPCVLLLLCLGHDTNRHLLACLFWAFFALWRWCLHLLLCLMRRTMRLPPNPSQFNTTVKSDRLSGQFTMSACTVSQRDHCSVAFWCSFIDAGLSFKYVLKCFCCIKARIFSKWLKQAQRHSTEKKFRWTAFYRASKNCFHINTQLLHP